MWGDDYIRDCIFEAITADTTEENEWKILLLEEMRWTKAIVDHGLTSLAMAQGFKYPNKQTIGQTLKSGGSSSTGTFDQEALTSLVGD